MHAASSVSDEPRESWGCTDAPMLLRAPGAVNFSHPLAPGVGVVRVDGYADRPRSEKGGGDGFEGVRGCRGRRGGVDGARAARYIPDGKRG